MDALDDVVMKLGEKGYDVNIALERGRSHEVYLCIRAVGPKKQSIEVTHTIDFDVLPHSDTSAVATILKYGLRAIADKIRGGE